MDLTNITTLNSVFRLALPEVVLVAFACVLFLGATLGWGRTAAGSWTLIGLLCSGIAMLFAPSADGLNPAASALWPDSFATLIRFFSLTGGLGLLFTSWSEMTDDIAADYWACFLVLLAGLGIIGSANELITLFLALELVSIPTYVMLYLPRAGKPVQEAAVKYFLLSIFSSALLLFGFAYLYGATGSTNLTVIYSALSPQQASPLPELLIVAFVMIVAGLGFRITAVPFHFYAPDVYEGSAVSLGALLAYAPKVAGFAALLHVFGYVGPVPKLSAVLENHQLPLLLWMLAATTMTLGNVLAMWQDNLKRLLAYSGIAHSGYMLIGLAVAPYLVKDSGSFPGGVAALLFYLAAYGAMTIGVFCMLNVLATKDRVVEKVDDLAGLHKEHPGLALLMSLFLFSLIGLPLTAGFVGKWLLFLGALAVEAPDGLFVALAVIAAINAAIGAYYYLRLIAIIYLREAIRPLRPTFSLPGMVCLWACAFVIVWLGCYPAPVLTAARKAAQPSLPSKTVASVEP